MIDKILSRNHAFGLCVLKCFLPDDVLHFHIRPHLLETFPIWRNRDGEPPSLHVVAKSTYAKTMMYVCEMMQFRYGFQMYYVVHGEYAYPIFYVLDRKLSTPIPLVLYLYGVPNIGDIVRRSGSMIRKRACDVDSQKILHRDENSLSLQIPNVTSPIGARFINSSSMLHGLTYKLGDDVDQKKCAVPDER